ALVAVDDVAEAADHVEHRALALASAPDARDRLGDAVGQTAERQRLQPDVAGPGERREEEALTTEERGLHPAHELHVVADRGLERHQASGVDAQRLAGAE